MLTYEVALGADQAQTACFSVQFRLCRSDRRIHRAARQAVPRSDPKFRVPRVPNTGSQTPCRIANRWPTTMHEREITREFRLRAPTRTTSVRVPPMFHALFQEAVPTSCSTVLTVRISKQDRKHEFVHGIQVVQVVNETDGHELGMDRTRIDMEASAAIGESACSRTRGRNEIRNVRYKAAPAQGSVRMHTGSTRHDSPTQWTFRRSL